MKKNFYIILLCFGILIVPQLGYAQEENADTTNEVVEDAFQEQFYEALKQKGIENYDKAIQALLECKQIDPKNHVVDYELGVNYMFQNKFAEAESYFLTAIEKEPDNKWYLDALLNCYKAQQNIGKAIEVAKKLSNTKANYKLMLADLYVDQKSYNKAMEVLDAMKEEGGNLTEIERRRVKITMIQNMNALADEYNKTIKESELTNNPVENYKNRIQELHETGEYNEMLSVSSEALDNYPTQPGFYYLKGVALNRLKNYKMAVKVLEEGLVYLLGDIELENNIYKELVLAYQAMGNSEKEKEYQLKMKENK
ncbi:hypothetical protein OOZ15_14690 [Galbibacter sp. EGI 63066]|uniref:tetratricopeptide repeat protein n=1 Tax=Galbibacter sp. EGI 63066 TaxID=2993559 RepID=UPI0022499BC5|nr:hypothetical protein [Galbibacter sp. EGI 63066]MCX2681197.1 hypothetical protein [Galbibacter sp. EGI 63066]